MSRRPTLGSGGRRTATCPQCAAQIYWATAPWGKVMLEPFPDPDGRLQVDVFGSGLLVLGPADKPSSITKRWERHSCAARGVPRPKPQPEQLDLF